MARVQRVLTDFHDFGVPHIWLVHPYEGRAYRYTGRALENVEDRVLRCAKPAFEQPLDNIFKAVTEGPALYQQLSHRDIALLRR